MHAYIYTHLHNTHTNIHLYNNTPLPQIALGKQLMSQRILLLTKLIKKKDRWVIYATMDPRNETQRLDKMEVSLEELYRVGAITLYWWCLVSFGVVH